MLNEYKLYKYSTLRSIYLEVYNTYNYLLLNPKFMKILFLIHSIISNRWRYRAHHIFDHTSFSNTRK